MKEAGAGASPVIYPKLKELTMQINTKELEKLIEDLEKKVDARCRDICTISQKSKKPLPNINEWGWSSSWDYGPFVEVDGNNVYLCYTSSSRCGCCSDDSKTVSIPVNVWDDPTEDAIIAWRNRLFLEEETKRLEEETAKKIREEAQDMETYLALKEKFNK